MNIIAFFSSGNFINKSVLTLILFVGVSIKQRKVSLRLCKLWVISSSLIVLFWGIFSPPFLSANCLIALTRFWLLIMAGYILIAFTSIEEVIDLLLNIKLNSNVVLFLIVIYNSFDYFIDSYKSIIYGYNLRFGKNNVFSKNYRVLLTMCIDFMMLLSECEKISEFEQERLVDSIEKRRYIQSVENQH